MISCANAGSGSIAPHRPDRALSALATVDVWILIMTIVGVVIACLTLVKGS